MKNEDQIERFLRMKKSFKNKSLFLGLNLKFKIKRTSIKNIWYKYIWCTSLLLLRYFKILQDILQYGKSMKLYKKMECNATKCFNHLT